MMKRVVVIPEPILDDYGLGRFVITGCQRSGTTLLGMVLEAHPNVDLIDEQHPDFHPFGEITRELDVGTAAAHQSGVDRLVGFKAPRDSHRLHDIVQAIPHVRFLWLERDVLQVVSSMLSLRIQNSVWALEFAPREIKKHIAATADQIAEHLFASAGELPEESDRAVLLAALCWVVKREQRRAGQGAHASRMHHINYEDLVTDPEGSTRRLLAFLDLEWHDAVLTHHTAIDDAPEFTRPGGAVSTRPVDTGSLKKWRSLSGRQLSIVETVVRDYEAGSRQSP